MKAQTIRLSSRRRNACRIRGGPVPRPAAPSASRRVGSRISAARAAARAGGSPGGTSTPVRPSTISSAMPGSRGRDAGKALALRLHQHVRQAVAVAVLADLGGEHEQIGLAIGGEHRGLRLAPRHSMRPSRPSRRGLRASALGERRRRRYGRSARPGRPAAAPARRAGRRSPFSRPPARPTAASPGRAGSLPSSSRGGRRRGETGRGRGRDSDSATLPASGASAARWRRAGFGAGHRPFGRGQLAALLPLRRRPDVLGVRRHRPGRPRIIAA